MKSRYGGFGYSVGQMKNDFSRWNKFIFGRAVNIFQSALFFVSLCVDVKNDIIR